MRNPLINGTPEDPTSDLVFEFEPSLLSSTFGLRMPDAFNDELFTNDVAELALRELELEFGVTKRELENASRGVREYSLTEAA